MSDGVVTQRAEDAVTYWGRRGASEGSTVCRLIEKQTERDVMKSDWDL